MELTGGVILIKFLKKKLRLQLSVDKNYIRFTADN